MTTSTLTSKGQTTIPRAVREHLHLRPGDRLEFIIDEAGQVRLLPATQDVRQLKGLLPAPKRPVSLDQMEQAIADGAARR